MEDTTVLKQHYLYMFRLDVVDVENYVPTEDRLVDYFEKYKFCNWIGKQETGKITGKLHWQLALWSEQVKTKNEIVAARKYWTDRLGKATCALKSGRKIQSLCSYCTKEEGFLFTNLTDNVIARIPKWRNKSAESIAWNEKIQQFIEEHEVAEKSKVSFALALMEFYKKNNKRPMRQTIQYLMWKYNKINHYNLLSDWRLVPDIDSWTPDEEEYEPESKYVAHYLPEAEYPDEEINHKM